MLKSLTTLIKINKAQLDEKRRQLAVLLDKKQQHIDEIKRLEDSIKYESDNLARTAADFRPMFLNFVMGVRKKEEVILAEIDKLNPQINKMTDEISIIFSEMKKYEIVKENRETELELELQRKTQIEIDEMAISNFVRRNAENL